MTGPTLAGDPAVHLWAVVALLLVLKMMALGWWTSALRIRRRVYATPEDYVLRQLTPAGVADEDVERVRRAHRNDLENVLPFIAASFVYVLTGPGPGAARVYLVGFLVARTLHSVFYVGALQPWRTLAFLVGHVLMLVMLGSTLAALVR
jgi:glutathione S-transferase